MIKPSSITANRPKKQLEVTWEDDHHSTYPFTLLRLGCPCVSCRGGHEKMGGPPDPMIFSKQVEDSPAYHLVAINMVGSYAVSPVWEDGHEFGIFNWQYLRLLCPCSDCRVKNK